MKKILCTLILLVCSTLIISANTSYWTDSNGNYVSDEEVAEQLGNSIMDGATEIAKQMLPVYEKLKTCSEASNEHFTIYGLENNKCHFKYVNYDCYLPMNITARYVQESIKGVKEIFNGNLSTSSSETQYIDSILKNQEYCSQGKMEVEFEFEVVDENNQPIEFTFE